MKAHSIDQTPSTILVPQLAMQALVLAKTFSSNKSNEEKSQ
jgi:hypothetical protein